MADNIELKAREIKNAIVNLWDQAVKKITLVSGSIYEIEFNSAHNFQKDSYFSDYVTIYVSGESSYTLGTNYFQFPIHTLTSTTKIRVSSPDYNLVTISSTSRAKLFTGHLTDNYPGEFDNKGTGIYPISKYPVVVVFGVADIWDTTKPKSLIGYRIQVDIIDINNNHDLNSYGIKNDKTSIFELECANFCANRMNYIVSKLAIDSINASNPFADSANYAKDSRGYHIDFNISKSRILSC